MKYPTDPNLRLIRRGDKEAYKVFVKFWYDTVYHFAESFMIEKKSPYKDPKEIAQEITREVFDEFWRERKRIKEDMLVKTYLINMVFRIGVKVIRKYEIPLN